jgi:prepilin-type N-terminal cleavage/methylation domain-containing protein
MRKFLDRARREESGFTLIELLVVIVILGILATIVVINVTGAATKAKQSSFKTTLATLQTASDEYYFDNTAYAVYSGCTPSSSTACQLEDSTLVPQYLHTNLDTNAPDYGVTSASTMYFGVTSNGKVFATTTAPSSNNWTCTSDTLTGVYTQTSIPNTTSVTC